MRYDINLTFIYDLSIESLMNLSIVKNAQFKEQRLSEVRKKGNPHE